MNLEILLMISLSIHFAYGTCNESEFKSYTRLPGNIKPLNYALRFQPDFTTDTDPIPFYGSMNLTFTVLESTENITLNVHKLNIDKSTITVTDSNGERMDIKDSEYKPAEDFYVISLRNGLAKDGKYTLTIDSFEGILNKDNLGFYRVLYNEDGEENQLAITKFETISARQTFPSMDEPEWKATFTITLVRPSDYQTISNTRLLQSNSLDEGDLIEDTYKETPIMSTYLLAFVISKFDSIERENHRVFARPEAIRAGMADYALNTSVDMLKAFEEYLQVPYVLDKMDQVAIPNRYFDAGAMENWGLVMYKEQRLLFSLATGTTHQQQAITITIAHEFTHQWFGNLVTLAWWRYTWLNEGFARYFGSFGASLIRPTWRLMEQFIEIIQKAFKQDSFVSAKALNYDHSSIDSIPSIAYSKGSAVIRMMAHVLTEDVFRNGLNIYLRNREFNTSVPDDLYNSLQTALDMTRNNDLLGGRSVTAVFSPWTDNPGHPLLTITRDYQTGHIKLEQERFKLAEKKDRCEYQIGSNLWPVPVNFMFSAIDNFDFSTTTAQYWLADEEHFLNQSFPKDGFLIANKQHTGFYRINYDYENWLRIADFLKEDNLEEIHVVNRAQLLNDAFVLARNGIINYSMAFNLSNYMYREKDYVPVKSFIYQMQQIRETVAAAEEYALFKEYVISMLNGAAGPLTFYHKPKDTHVDRLNRALVMSTLCEWGSLTCREEALEVLREWQSGEIVQIAPDMQTYAFCGALAIGNSKDWTFLHEKYENEENEETRIRLLQGLGCSTNRTILTNFLDKIFHPESDIPKHEKKIAIKGIFSSSSMALDVVLNYISSNQADVISSSLDIKSFITDLVRTCKTSEQLNQVTKFANAAGQEKTTSGAIRSAKTRIEKANGYAPVIIAGLQLAKMRSK